ncbi:MAG: hypothetical protein RMJ98_11450 [Myxococcales bacterium]|nr:hypothetical protein [Polyangiaceae bacterium]MDW8249903.1 hypothetical protein [Myxococcales bacterium]
MQPPTLTEDTPPRLGRKIALTIFYGLVVVFTLGAAVQISVQVYSSDAPWEGGCPAGLRMLARSIQEAQRASEGADLATEEALQQFRRTLATGWNARNAIERSCKASGDRRLLDTFDAIERLRYAEENAMRREGHDLVPLRRRVQVLLGELPGGASP